MSKTPVDVKIKVLNETFRHKVMSVTGDIDNVSDENAFDDAIVKILDAYSVDCSVEVKMHGFMNTRGTETRVATCIITNKRRVFNTMDRVISRKVDRVGGGKYILDRTVVEKVFDAIGLNFALDSKDEELLHDVEEFCVYTGMTNELNGWDWERVQQEWNDFQSK